MIDPPKSLSHHLGRAGGRERKMARPFSSQISALPLSSLLSPPSSQWQAPSVWAFNVPHPHPRRPRTSRPNGVNQIGRMRSNEMPSRKRQPFLLIEIEGRAPNGSARNRYAQTNVFLTWDKCIKANQPNHPSQ